MDDTELESLAVKEIIDEIERKKRIELESQRPPHRQIRPNKRFLGRTIVSVLQHNNRQYAEERRNSSIKLKELNERRRRSPRRRSIEHTTVKEHPPEIYEQLLKGIKAVPKKTKKKKKRADILTIDLTKKKKRVKEKKKKRKVRKKKIKSKKRRRRKESTSSSSSSPSSSSSCTSSISCSDSESSSCDVDHSSLLLIDLT